MQWLLFKCTSTNNDPPLNHILLLYLTRRTHDSQLAHNIFGAFANTKVRSVHAFVMQVSQSLMPTKVDGSDPPRISSGCRHLHSYMVVLSPP